MTPDLLFRDFPKGMDVLHAQLNAEGNLEFLVEQDGLPDVSLIEGQAAPIATATFDLGIDRSLTFRGWSVR